MLKCFTDLEATRGIFIYWYEMYTYHFKFLLIENKKTYSLNLFISFIAYKIYKYNIFVKLNFSKRRKQIYYEVLKMLLFYNFQWGYAINTNFFLQFAYKLTVYFENYQFVCYFKKTVFSSIVHGGLFALLVLWWLKWTTVQY